MGGVSSVVAGCCSGSSRFNGQAPFPGTSKLWGEEKELEQALTFGYQSSLLDDNAAELRQHKHEQISSFLKKVPLFKRLSNEERHLLALKCERKDYDDGDVVIKQGEEGDAFFLITAGEAVVSVSKENGLSGTWHLPSGRNGSIVDVAVVNTLKAGDYVGETALLENSRRNATVTAKSCLSVLRLSQVNFKNLNLDKKLKFGKRKAVGGGECADIVKKPPSPKTPAERELMAEALHANHAMEGVITWSDELVNGVIDTAWKEEVAADIEIIQRGDTAAHHFYIVNSGSFEFLIPQDGNGSENSDQELVRFGVVHAGGSFGELALMYNHPRAATVRALEDSVLWVIDRTSFKQMLMHGSDKTQEYKRCLDKVEMFNSLLQVEKEAVASALTQRGAHEGEVLMRQGEPGDRMYILYEGSVDICQDGKVANQLQAGKTIEEAHVIGESALLEDQPRAATVTVSSSEAALLVLDRSEFEHLLGSLHDIMTETKSEQRSASLVGGVQRGTGKTFTAMHDVSFESLKRVQKGLLGCGAFGVVDLVKVKDEEKYYALKGLSKGHIVQCGMQKRTMQEKNILMMLDSPFIVKLYACYNESQALYFLLELAQGGELFEIFEKLDLAGSPPHAKYYSASVTLAFEHMHLRKIIYRDLKLENLLLDKDGHLKVADMGLAKFTFGKAYTTCGTPEYFAPEVVQSVGHTVAADWWALGILIYEMMDGSSPFAADSQAQIYKKIVKGCSKLKWRGDWKEKRCGLVKDIITKLLQEDPKKRLPMLMGGVGNLKKHEWFADTNFDWDSLANGTLMTAYQPLKDASKGKFANFAAAEGDKPPQIDYVDDGSGWDKDFAT